MRLSRRMRPLPLSNVRVTDPFWRRWQETVRDTSLKIQYEQCVATGRIENFHRAARGEKGTHQGYRYNDSDLYKWVEATCMLEMALGPDEQASRRLDEVVAAIASAQLADGYLNTFFQIQHPDLRWRNLSMMHEMYCGGHLIEAAVMHRTATGKRDLFDVGVRFADHVASIFGPGKRKGYCGHQEFELALLMLADAIDGEDPARAATYRTLSKWMVDERGTRPSPFEEEYADTEAMALCPYARSMLDRDGVYSGEYLQDHLPLREQTEVVGHAVRLMYWLAAATEVYTDRGDDEVESALERLWINLTHKRMYITGGIGPAAHNEGFTTDYDLPNRTAYAETCASVGLIFWARRLLEGTADSEYADVIERALYNGALAGISLSGDRFFYVNPLESNGNHHRQPWFDCACCPPNIARLIASVANCLVASGDGAVYVNIPASFEARIPVGQGEVTMAVRSSYPWAGKFEVEVDSPNPMEFALCIRVPDWASDTDLALPDDFEPAEYESGYMVIRRTWSGKTTLMVEFAMSPTWMAAHPKVIEDRGRAALTCGPLVYSLEAVDLGQAPHGFVADTSAADLQAFDPSVLEGIVPITVSGWLDDYAEWGDELYAPDDTLDPAVEAKARMVPYFAWDNRQPGAMQVWLRRP